MYSPLVRRWGGNIAVAALAPLRRRRSRVGGAAVALTMLVISPASERLGALPMPALPSGDLGFLLDVMATGTRPQHRSCRGLVWRRSSGADNAITDQASASSTDDGGAANVDYEAAFAQRLREVKANQFQKEQPRRRPSAKPGPTPFFGEVLNGRATESESGKNFLNTSEWDTLKLVLFSMGAITIVLFVVKVSQIPGFFK
mmetsp:Transcript_66933/g.186865  ORF Transcript_66933/g.186865 Transcript_66933/m.186865 type:complete len:201 (-) Transcript_66933:121-723(-)